MKKKLPAILLIIVLVSSAFAFSACSVFDIFDHDVRVVLNNMGNIQDTYTISLFKNAILADIDTNHVIGVTEVEEDGATVIKDVEFLGWHPDPSATNGMYKARGLVRLVEVEEYIHDGVLVLYAIYGVKVIEKHDLVIAWYGQAVSGLTDGIMDNYSTALFAYLEDELKLFGLDVVIVKYIGDVATSCIELTSNGGADIMLGWGSNLTTTGNIPTLDRKSDVPMGNKTGRYIDLIRETVKMFDANTSISRLIWQWTIDNASLLL